jgi:hypothetical protein
MTDLEPMWDALAKYQPYADQDGHGNSWRRMCNERTPKAAWDASEAAQTPAAAAAYSARCSLYWADSAIERIETEIKERA